MPHPKQYFPVSHDLVNDPEFDAMMREYGDRFAVLWLVLLSGIDRSENAFRITQETIIGIARRVRQSSSTVSRTIGGLSARGWVTIGRPSGDPYPTVLSSPNYWKYHRRRSPAWLPPTDRPTDRVKEREREEKEKSAAPENGAALALNGEPPTKAKKLKRLVAQSPKIPIPDDWVPKPNHARFATNNNLDLRLESLHFVGRSKELAWVTIDWDRKFSNWMLQELKFRARPKPGGA